MQKPEKTLLKFAIIGTALIFGMASISYIFFREPAAPSSAVPVSEADMADSENRGSESMSTSDAPAFVIDETQSDIRFSLGETLGGERITVVGDTDIFSGTLYFSGDAPQDVSIGEILINARDLETDNSFRNRALQNQILNTSAYEYIRFVPVTINGLPETVNVGDEVIFDIVGDLTIKDVTHQVTFSTQATWVSETQIDGYASTTIAYADYDIFIPSAPRVADVDDDVLLEIEFVALAE